MKMRVSDRAQFRTSRVVSDNSRILRKEVKLQVRWACWSPITKERSSRLKKRNLRLLLRRWVRNLNFWTARNQRKTQSWKTTKTTQEHPISWRRKHPLLWLSRTLRGSMRVFRRAGPRELARREKANKRRIAGLDRQNLTRKTYIINATVFLNSVATCTVTWSVKQVILNLTPLSKTVDSDQSNQLLTDKASHLYTTTINAWKFAKNINVNKNTKLPCKWRICLRKEWRSYNRSKENKP